MVSIRSINTSEQEILIATINQPARKALQLLLVDGTPTVHNVYFVKYDVTVSFMAQVFDFKIGLSLFGCAEKYTFQSTHCAVGRFRPKTEILGQKKEPLPNSNHVLATTGKCCSKKKVTFSQIIITQNIILGDFLE